MRRITFILLNECVIAFSQVTYWKLPTWSKFLAFIMLQISLEPTFLSFFIKWITDEGSGSRNVIIFYWCIHYCREFWVSSHEICGIWPYDPIYYSLHLIALILVRMWSHFDSPYSTNFHRIRYVSSLHISASSYAYVILVSDFCINLCTFFMSILPPDRSRGTSCCKSVHVRANVASTEIKSVSLCGVCC